jgi:hypothetical protein
MNTNIIRIFCVGITFLLTCSFVFSQEYEKTDELSMSIYEEADLYVDGDSKPQKTTEHRESYGGGGGYSVSLFNENTEQASTESIHDLKSHVYKDGTTETSHTKRPDQGIESPIDPPGDPDLPINKQVYLLIVVGLGYGIYKIRRLRKEKYDLFYLTKY